MKIIIDTIKEIKECTFNFHGGLDHLESFNNYGTERYWRIGMRVKQDDTDTRPYVLIMYQLRIGDQEFHLSPDSISFENNAVNKSIDYAKRRLIEHIENIPIIKL